MTRTPSSDLDLFTEAAILDPYPGYAELRAIGPAVWLTQHDMWCVPQFDAVKRVLGDYRTFTTAKGVAMEAAVNGATSGPGKADSLTSDPPLHDEIRRITGAPLTPKALRTVEGEIKAVAQALVADLCQRREVDGMVDVAQHLPLNIVTELVGLPKDAEQHMLKWAAATFNAMGPMNDLCKAALPQIAEQHAFCNDPDMPSRLRSGGWADRIFQAAGRGDVALPPDEFNRLAEGISDKLGEAAATGAYAALVTTTRRRRFLRTVLAAKGILNPVLSFEEIGIDAKPALVGLVAA